MRSIITSLCEIVHTTEAVFPINFGRIDTEENVYKKFSSRTSHTPIPSFGPFGHCIKYQTIYNARNGIKKEAELKQK